MKLYLASASPRRREIMAMLPFEFEVFVPDFDEKAYEAFVRRRTGDVLEITSEVAKGKALAAYEQLKRMFPEQQIAVLSADTVVILDGEIFGKGENRQKSIDMLCRLNGREHEVVSAVWLLGDIPEKNIIETSKVIFAKIDEKLIIDYVDREKPYDKSGSYGIQEGGGLFMEKIEGNFYNIMGLPLYQVYEMLKEYDWQLRTRCEVFSKSDGGD